MRRHVETAASGIPECANPLQLNAHGVSFSYGRKDVVREVSITLEPGQFAGLIGPNGSGKTTLMHLLSGFLRPSAGTVELNGKAMDQWPRRDAARMIAVVAQHNTITFPFRVLDVVMMGRHPYCGTALTDREEDRVVASDALERVNIPHLRSSIFTELSGGEQRLVLIAQALAQQTPFILLDEPLAALDLKHQWQILKLLRDLCGAGTSVLASFHDLSIAAGWAGQLFLLHEGRLAAHGPPDVVLNQDLLRDVYGLPLQITNGADGTFVTLPISETKERHAKA